MQSWADSLLISLLNGRALEEYREYELETMLQVGWLDCPDYLMACL